MTSRFIRPVALAGALALAGLATAAPRVVATEEDQSRIWAKVASERAKANAARSRGGADIDDSRCGSVDIGNVDTGSSRRAPREVITVITGDVVNAPGRCR